MLKTWIALESGPEASLVNLFSSADYCQIRLPRTRAILGEVRAAVRRWRQLAKGLGMRATEIDAFAGAFEYRESASASRSGPWLPPR